MSEARLPREGHVVLAGGDAGSAGVLIPVAAELLRRGVAIDVHASGPAWSVWPGASASPAVHRHAEPVSSETARHGLIEASALVVGAGVFNSIEHAFRLGARDHGVPSIAVLDSWGRVLERFARRGAAGVEVCFPDFACALDERSRSELLAAGFRVAQVRITGSPYLEGVSRYFSDLGKDAAEWRRGFGIAPVERLVLFASESFAAPEDRSPDGSSLVGYDQATILQAVLRATEAAAMMLGQPAVVVARPHPTEDEATLSRVARGWRSGRVRLRVTSEGEARQWVAAADVVTGMASIVLLEAALAGKPALSVQIGRRPDRPDPNQANGLGLTLAIHDQDSLSAHLHAALEGRGFAPDPRALAALAVPGCAARIADLAVQAGSRRASPRS